MLYTLELCLCISLSLYQLLQYAPKYIYLGLALNEFLDCKVTAKGHWIY